MDVRFVTSTSEHGCPALIVPLIFLPPASQGGTATSSLKFLVAVLLLAALPADCDIDIGRQRPATAVPDGVTQVELHCCLARISGVEKCD